MSSNPSWSAFPFLHQATNRRYRLSTDGKFFVFEDGSRVAVPGPSSSQSSPTGLSVGDPTKPRALKDDPIKDPTQPVQWTVWKQNQSLSRGSTVLFLAGSDGPPFTRKRLLGSGMHATVSKVVLDGSREICALKAYRPIAPFQTIREKFENEIHNMRRVSNRHIARFFAAYIYERKQQPPEFGILMQPVADGGTLESAIDNCRRSPNRVTKEQRNTLMTSFGCLSSALEFVHRHFMRHKDVKSSNILLHEGRVLLADFGSSWDGYTYQTLTTSSGDPKGYSHRYFAPEINTRDPRNAKSDVFSLGGVFYEILCGLEPDAWWYGEDFWKIARDLRSNLGQWRNTLPEVIHLIYLMLDPAPNGRPWAGQLVANLPAKHFCDRCCQEHKKGMTPANAGKQTENLMSSMSRLSIQGNQGVVARSFAPSEQRGSKPKISMSQEPTRAYTPRRMSQSPELHASSVSQDRHADTENPYVFIDAQNIGLRSSDASQAIDEDPMDLLESILNPLDLLLNHHVEQLTTLDILYEVDDASMKLRFWKLDVAESKTDPYYNAVGFPTKELLSLLQQCIDLALELSRVISSSGTASESSRPKGIAEQLTSSATTIFDSVENGLQMAENIPKEDDLNDDFADASDQTVSRSKNQPNPDVVAGPSASATRDKPTPSTSKARSLYYAGRGRTIVSQEESEEESSDEEDDSSDNDE